MHLHVDANTFFVFDLDDTLFYEIDFLKSAYRYISYKLFEITSCNLYEIMWEKYRKEENVFKWIVETYNKKHQTITLEWLLSEYRNHIPEIQLSGPTWAFLQQVQRLSIPTGLITDGRSITQRNKLKALRLDNYFQDIIISEEFGSEKPDEQNYLYFERKYKGKRFFFFGDNTSKDFIVPDKLGWKSICIKNSGHNIHTQDLLKKPVPDIIISSFQEISLHS